MTDSFFVCNECHKGEPCYLHIVGTEHNPDLCPFSNYPSAAKWVLIGEVVL